MWIEDFGNITPIDLISFMPPMPGHQKKALSTAAGLLMSPRSMLNP
jgi:hypothetical protein